MAKKISIIIPCKNEKEYIGKCLDSIAHCNYDKNLLKVYVCDGLSTDGTAEIIREYANRFSFIFYRENKKQTTPYALNLGIRESDSEIDIILGAHSEIHSDYITNCLSAFEINPAIGCVGGVLENVYENPISEVIGKAMSSSFGVGNAYFRTGAKNGYVDTVAFGAYKKEIFDKIGYFDEDLARNQDDEFNYRLLKAGYKIYLSSSIKVKYFTRSSFGKLSKQYFQYGYWKVYVNKKHNTITTLRQIVPAAFVGFLLLGIILTLFNSIFFMFYITVIVLYLLLAGVAASNAKNLKEYILLVYTFLLLHSSYGTGYIEGIWNFMILRKQPSNTRTIVTR